MSRCVWQARPGWPLMRTPHEPQIAARQEQRMPIEPSKRALACRMPSSTERCGSSSIGVLVPVRRLARLGVVAADAERELLGLLVDLGHQYLRSSGCHWVIVTGE